MNAENVIYKLIVTGNSRSYSKSGVDVISYQCHSGLKSDRSEVIFLVQIKKLRFWEHLSLTWLWTQNKPSISNLLSFWGKLIDFSLDVQFYSIELL